MSNFRRDMEYLKPAQTMSPVIHIEYHGPFKHQKDRPFWRMMLREDGSFFKADTQQFKWIVPGYLSDMKVPDLLGLDGAIS